MRNRSVPLIVLTALLGALCVGTTSGPGARAGDVEADAVYTKFNTFCIENYGARAEPLIYEKFGTKLKIVDSGSWRHVSENSACIAFETNLPATTYVEYGETAGYGRKTSASERSFYVHVHYLRGLQVGRTYHYRLVATDERGKKLAGPDATFTTRRVKGAVRIPAGNKGAPFVLDKKGATYVLTGDVTADGLGIRIDAGDVTVDLNGHTLTYNDKPVKFDDPKDYQEFRTKRHGGVMAAYGAGGLRILNGTIRQGAGRNGAWGNGSGFAPIYLNGNGGEIAGVTCEYSGRQVSGMYLQNPKRYHVHHNVIKSHTTDPGNRHQGSSAITGAPGRIHHNLVKRVCHKGISVASGTKGEPVEVFSNEVYVDSYATNAYGINCYKNSHAVVKDNRIFTSGYHTSALPTVSCSHLKVHGNLMHMVAGRPTSRFKEYGPMSKHHGFRIKYNPEGGNLDFHRNLVIAVGRDGGCVKGATVKGGKDMTDVVFRDNVFKQTYEGVIDPKEKRSSIAAAAQWSCAVAYVGDAKGSIIFKGNTIISNYRNITLDDGYYASGSNATFIDNKLVRIGSRKDYTTIRCGWWNKDHTGNMLIDTILVGGADLANVCFLGTGKNDFSVAWTLTVATEPGATVVIADRTGREAFKGVADEAGRAEAVLLQYRHAQKIPRLDTRGVKTLFTPHSVTVTKAGKSGEKTVTVDGKKKIEVKLR